MRQNSSRNMLGVPCAHCTVPYPMTERFFDICVEKTRRCCPLPIMKDAGKGTLDILMYIISRYIPIIYPPPSHEARNTVNYTMTCQPRSFCGLATGNLDWLQNVYREKIAWFSTWVNSEHCGWTLRGDCPKGLRKMSNGSRAAGLLRVPLQFFC